MIMVLVCYHAWGVKTIFLSVCLVAFLAPLSSLQLIPLKYFLASLTKPRFILFPQSNRLMSYPLDPEGFSSG